MNSRIKLVLLFLLTLFVLWGIRRLQAPEVERKERGDTQSVNSSGASTGSNPEREPNALKSPSGLTWREDGKKVGMGGKSNVQMPGKRVSSNPTERSIAAFFRAQGPGQWRVRMDDKGKVMRLLGGEVASIGNSREQMGRFIQKLVPELGIPPEQVASLPVQDETRQFLIFDSQQTYKGYPVYQAWLRVLANKHSGAGFLFNNNLKSIESEIQLAVEMTLIEAQESLLEQLRPYGHIEIYSSQGPVVWADGSPHQLAYVFHLNLPRDTVRIVLSARTGDILSQQSTRFH